MNAHIEGQAESGMYRLGRRGRKRTETKKATGARPTHPRF